jgi:hypothetical protein
VDDIVPNNEYLRRNEHEFTFSPSIIGTPASSGLGLSFGDGQISYGDGAFYAYAFAFSFSVFLQHSTLMVPLGSQQNNE